MYILPVFTFYVLDVETLMRFHIQLKHDPEHCLLRTRCFPFKEVQRESLWMSLEQNAVIPLALERIKRRVV